MLLKEAIQCARDNEKQNNTKCVVYQVYENDSLIYVGIGGKGKRNGSGRLAEHKSESLFSSLKSQYYISKWDKGYTRQEASKMWDNLNWKITQYTTIKEADNLETNLVKKFNPIFNRNKK